jgi:hypothetical protein
LLAAVAVVNAAAVAVLVVSIIQVSICHWGLLKLSQ